MKKKMTKKSTVDKRLAGVQKELRKRLEELTGSLQKRESFTTKALPQNWSEAAEMKAEMGVSEAVEQSLTAEIKSIQNALKSIERGNYGACVSCRKPIPVERLKARPSSTHCVACKARIK